MHNFTGPVTQAPHRAQYSPLAGKNLPHAPGANPLQNTKNEHTNTITTVRLNSVPGANPPRSTIINLNYYLSITGLTQPGMLTCYKM